MPVKPVKAITSFLQVLVLAAPNQQVLAPQPKRLWVQVYNAGAIIVFVGSSSIGNANTGFPLPPGMSVKLDGYQQPLYLFAQAPNLVGVVEAIEV